MTPILWGALGALAIIAGLGLALKVQSARLDASQAAEKACTIRYEDALGTIGRQNKAFADLKEAQDKAQAESKRRLAALEARRRGVETSLAKLRAQKPPVGSQCPSGEAISRIRKLL